MLSISRNSIVKFIDGLILYVLASFSFLYTIFWSDFAEIYVKLSFLDFPVFVGEILLAFCLILLGIKWYLEKKRFVLWHGLMALYFFWIIIKALKGYFDYGPLSFRNAALFYYAIFAVISYSSFRREFLTPIVCVGILCAVIVSRLGFGWNRYFFYSFYVVAWLCAFSVRRKWFFLILCGIIVYALPFKEMFNGSRSQFIGCMAAFLMIGGSLFVRYLKQSRKRALLIVAVGLICFVAVLFFYPNKKQLRSISTPSKIVKSFRAREAFLQEFSQFFVRKKLKSRIFKANQTSVNEGLQGASTDWLMAVLFSIKDPQERQYMAFKANLLQSIYNRELLIKATSDIDVNQVFVDQSQFHEERGKTQKGILGDEKLLAMKDVPGYDKTVGHLIDRLKTQEGKQQIIEGINSINKKSPFRWKEKGGKGRVGLVVGRVKSQGQKVQQIPGQKSYERTLDDEYENILFRVFIWRDMAAELLNAMPIFGMSFGWPQRSISIEILNMAHGEWTRDGWITPHSSFFHYIYRGGIIGIAMVCYIFGMIYFLMRKFFAAGSVRGVLLTSILVYWIGVACFLVVLELPYMAIPFWSLWGITLAYASQLNQNDVCMQNNKEI